MAKLIKRGERFGREPEYVATTITGLEGVLEEELHSLGAQDLRRGDRAVAFRAGTELLYTILLRSRLAMRILRKLHSFNAGSREELYRGVNALPWEQLITPADTFAIRPQSHSSFFKNAKFASQVVKDAIVDRQRRRTGKRSSIDSRQPDLQLQLRIIGREVELLLDASAGPLSRRGYRKQGGTAPMNEVLAAGLLDLAGWRGGRSLLDPFCGSGTILAEAVIKAEGVAPNAERQSWSHLRWPDHREELWRRVRAEAKVPARAGGRHPSDRHLRSDRQLHSAQKAASEAGDEGQGESAREQERKGGDGAISGSLFGVDIDPSQLSAARDNLRRLGAEDKVALTEGDALQLSSADIGLGEEDRATVITNIPYGERLGSEEGSDEEIRELYRAFGDWLKKSACVEEAWILTGNLQESRSFGLRSSARIELHNGPIECRLLHFTLY